MGSRTPPSVDGPMGDILSGIYSRLSTLEAPTGTSIRSLVDQVKNALANITTTVQNAISAQSRTKEDIDQRIANPPAGSAVTGNVSATGSVTSGGDMVAGGQLRAPDAVGFNITGTRRTAWIEDATGRFGYASSSRRFKTDIRPAGISAAAVRALEPKRFRYKEQVDEWGDDAPVEYGLIAEDLDAAGLHQFVIYDDDGTPEGIEYSMLVVAQQTVLRDQETRITKLEQALLRVSL